MSDDNHADAAQSAIQVPYAAFHSTVADSEQRPSLPPSANAHSASASRMTWGYWFVRGLFKLVIRLFMCVLETAFPRKSVLLRKI
jgi:hypothetical protein